MSRFCKSCSNEVDCVVVFEDVDGAEKLCCDCWLFASDLLSVDLDISTASANLLFVSASLAAIEEDAAFEEDSSANDDDLALDDSIDSETAFLLSAIDDCLSFDDFFAMLSERASADFVSLVFLSFEHAANDKAVKMVNERTYGFFNVHTSVYFNIPINSTCY